MQIRYLELYKYKRFPLLGKDRLVVDFTSKLNLILGANGGGKAQPLTAKIKTPDGWATMANMKVGTRVIAKDGSITRVNGVFPQGVTPVYKITFADGRIARATGDHLWRVYVGGKNYPIVPKIITTLEVLDYLNGKAYNNLLWVDLVDSEQNDDIPLEINPYLLGVLIGDGCLQSSIVITHPDEFIMKKITGLLDKSLQVNIRNIAKTDHCLTYSVVNTLGPKRGGSTLANFLHKNGLMFKRSHEKFIPEEYLCGSTRQRLELLQGLMDTDGTIGKHGTSSYCTTSFRLASQVQYLVRSLGGLARISLRHPRFTYKDVKKPGRVAYQINIRYKKPSELFTLPKKKDRTNDNNQYAPTLKLRILSIEPDGHEQTQCISIDHPDKLYVTDDFIVTHNSSLVNELSPLPSSKDDFFEGGYKCIVVEHLGNTYTLISDIANNSYSFLLGEEELNPSHLVTIQRELVHKHFALTQDIWEILTGKISFTDMPLPNRKKLFNALSHLNIETILDIYSEQKEQHKQQQMMLKTQSNLYTIEANKLLDVSLLDTLHARLDKNNEHLSALMDIRSALSSHLQGGQTSNRIQDYKTLKESIRSIQNQHYTLLTAFPYKQYDSTKASISSKLDLYQLRLQDLYRHIEGLETTLKSIELKKLNSKKSIEDKLAQHRAQVETQRTKLVYVQNLSGSIASDIHTFYYAISELVSEMPLNADKRYSKSVYEQTLERKANYLKDSQAHYSRQLYLAKQIELLEKQKQDNSVTCPECSHQWVLDYDPLKHQLLVDQKAQEDAKAVLTAQALEEIDKYLTEFSEYMGKYRTYAYLRQTYIEKFPTLFAEIDAKEYIFNAPRSILPLVNTAISDVNSLTEIAQLSEAILTLEKDLEIISDIDTDDTAAVLSEIEQTNTAITDLLYDKQLQTEYLHHNETSYKIATRLLSVESALQTTQDAILEHNLSYTLQKVITTIDTELNHIRLQNIETQTQLSNHNSINTIIEKYRQDIEDTTENIEVLKAITDELNPKSGIIGKIISNYLNSIIEYVNKIIRGLWNYKMELVAYNLESDLLDYRFKINVEDKLPVKDISLASSGMKEVINLAFKLAMMKLLNLNHYPLYLDEFGARLDTEHKSNIYNLIFKFLSDDNYSQIFLITHTDLAYSNFKDTQVITLS